MGKLLSSGTHVHEWEVEVDIQGVRSDDRGIPAGAEWVGLMQGDTGSARFRFTIRSRQPVDEEAGVQMAVGLAIEECGEWCPDAEVLGYRTFLNRSCLT
jgi:hypothetical protein